MNRRKRCGFCGAAPPDGHRISCPRRTRCRCGAPAVRGSADQLCAPCARARRREAVQRALDKLDDDR